VCLPGHLSVFWSVRVSQNYIVLAAQNLLYVLHMPVARSSLPWVAYVLLHKCATFNSRYATLKFRIACAWPCDLVNDKQCIQWQRSSARMTIQFSATPLVMRKLTRTSAVAEGSRDAPCQLQLCTVLHKWSKNFTCNLVTAEHLQSHSRSLQIAQSACSRNMWCVYLAQFLLIYYHFHSVRACL